MRRSIRRVIWSALLGVLTTIVVAWGCVCVISLKAANYKNSYSRGSHPRWLMSASEVFGRTRLRSIISVEEYPVQVSSAFGWSRVAKPPAALPKDGARSWRHEYAAGWPSRALVWWQDFEGEGKNRTAQSRVGAIDVGNKPSGVSRYDGDLILPLIPLWRGFLADTAIFGCAWWSVLASLRLLRQGVRRWRAQCPECGYDISGAAHDNCPECGCPRDHLRGTRFEQLLFRALPVLWGILLGIISTIGVAWGLAIWCDVMQPVPKLGWISPLPATWLIGRFDRVGASRVCWIIDSHAGNIAYWQAHPELPPDDIPIDQLQRIQLEAQKAFEVRPELVPNWGAFRAKIRGNPNTLDPGTRCCVEDARGWPCLAMWLSCEDSMTSTEAGDLGRTTREAIEGGVDLEAVSRSSLSTMRALPLRILLQGFVLDSLVYGLGWTALLLLAGTIVKRRLMPRSKQSDTTATT